MTLDQFLFHFFGIIATIFGTILIGVLVGLIVYYILENNHKKPKG